MPTNNNAVHLSNINGAGLRILQRQSSLMIQADRPICKESRVVLLSPENTTCIILAKTGSYILPKKDQSTL